MARDVEKDEPEDITSITSSVVAVGRTKVLVRATRSSLVALDGIRKRLYDV